MKIVILDKDTLGDDIDLSPLYENFEVREYSATPPQLIRERIADAEAVIVNKIKLSDANLSDTEVKLICVAATGYDNIDTEYIAKNSIALCNVPGYSTHSVAQLTVSMVMSLATHLGEYRDFVHSGEYSKSGIANKLTPVYHEVSSMKWGVVGGGAIGTRVAEIAETIGAEVYVCRRKKEGRFKIKDIDTICKTCDIITLHLPLSDETRNLINKERIANMKQGAIVVNTARGAVCDEDALAEAVLSGKLGGLGVDVYSEEPFPSNHAYSKLLGLSNVILTPHMAWGSKEARSRCINEIVKNIESFISGDKRNRIV